MDTVAWEEVVVESVDGRTPGTVAAAKLDGACLTAVQLTDTGEHPIVHTTLLVRGSGKEAVPVAALEGYFGELRSARDGTWWAWSNFEVEGTFSTLYRSTDDGRTWQRNTTLDAAVRERGGCCFTGIDAAFFRDRRRGAVQIHGLEDPELGWYGTEDGGATWTWLGAEPERRWRWATGPQGRERPGDGGCALEPLPVP